MRSTNSPESEGNEFDLPTSDASDREGSQDETTGPPPATTLAERHRLIEDHLRLVRSIAVTLRPKLGNALDFDDLMGYGYRGLVEAAHRFDPHNHGCFSTFAFFRIRGAMFDGAQRTGSYTRLEVARSRAESKLSALQQHESTGAPSPSHELSRLEDLLGRIATIYRSDERDISEFWPPGPHAALELEELRAAVREAVASLPPKERRLLELYYFAEKNLDDAGAELGINKSWASRIHSRAVELLRAALAAGPLDPTSSRR